MASLVEQVESLHRAAQGKLGLYAALLSADQFPSFQGSVQPSMDGWLDGLISQILELRELSGELAVSYYQLARWIETRHSLGAPLDSGASTGVDLLQSFIARVQAVEDIASSGAEVGFDIASALRSNKDHPLNSISLAGSIDELGSAFNMNGRVGVDEFSWPILSSNDRVRRAIATSLRNGADIDGRYAVARGAATPEELSDNLAKALESASSGGASKADMLVMSAGRGVVDYAHSADKRMLMYARGTSSNPCAFCAMLASRGFVYATKTSATKSYQGGAMKSYHENCHCFAIARWTDTSKLPALNAYFESEWPKVTKGYSGEDKLKAWRRWLNKKRRESRAGSRTEP